MSHPRVAHPLPEQTHTTAKPVTHPHKVVHIGIYFLEQLEPHIIIFLCRIVHKTKGYGPVGNYHFCTNPANYVGWQH